MPKSKRKFFRQVIEIEVLSEDEPLVWGDLGDVMGAIDTGPCSGKVREVSCTSVSGSKMAKLLQAQDSDPDFFNLTESGEDAD